MKKLLLLLFSLLLSFNSYGEWTELDEGDGFKTYLDLDTINKRDDYIYWWVMFSNNSDSAQVFFQGDCKLMADKVLESLTYERSMGQGVSKSITVLPPFKSTWTYLPPNGQRTEFLKLVCNLENQYPKQQLELINLFKEYLKKQKEEQIAFIEEVENDYDNLFPIIEGNDLFSDEIIKVSDLLPMQHTIVNVWASWCTTCRKEHQMLIDISEGTNLQLIGINFKDTREDAMQYLRTFGNPFDKVIFDPSGDISEELGVYATPVTFLINKENSEIVYKHIGELTEEVWDKNFENRATKVNHTKEQHQVLKSAYLSNISARVRSFWRYQGAEDDWECEVYVVQDRDGTVVAVDVRNCNVDDSGRAKAFKDSVRRAVYKSSPLPSAPDESVFDKELMITFSVN